MKRVRSKATGEVYDIKREYDDGSLLFSDGRIRKKETVEKYFEEVVDVESVDASGTANAKGGTGKTAGGRLGSHSAGDVLPPEDGEGEAGPDSASGGYDTRDGDSVLEVRA